MVSFLLYYSSKLIIPCCWWGRWGRSGLLSCWGMVGQTSTIATGSFFWQRVHCVPVGLFICCKICVSSDMQVVIGDVRQRQVEGAYKQFESS